MPDARRTRSLALRNEKHTSKVTTGTPRQSGIPCAMVLRFPSCSPVTGLFLPPSFPRNNSAKT
jgi:hypothetical protein